MADKCWLIYGLTCGLEEAEFLSYNGTAWTLHSAEYKKHLGAVSETGANAVRLLPYGGVWRTNHPYGKKGQLSPFAYVNETQGWNLAAWNEEFFDITRSAIEIINNLGMTAFYCLADNCEYIGATKKYSPWVSNTHSPAITSIYDTAAYPHWSAFILKCLSEFSGLDIMWPWGNEMANPAFRSLVSGPAHTIAGGVIAPLLDSGDLLPGRSTFGATMDAKTYNPATGEYGVGESLSTQDHVKGDIGAIFGDDIKLDIYKEIHSCGSPLATPDPNRPYGHMVDQACAWWGNSQKIRKIFSDDGVKNGNSTIDIDPVEGGAKPSAAYWHNMVLYILQRCKGSGSNHSVNFEHLPQKWTDAVQAVTWTAISTAYHEFFGVWPENYGTPPTVLTGSLKVALYPAEAVSAGAQWRVDGGAWRDTGVTVSGLSVGNHTITYKATAGYTSPASAVAQIVVSETTTKAGTYVLSADTGSIKVTITPAGAVTAGAKWYVDDSTERASGATVSGLTVGDHAVSFKAVALYTSPSDINATVANGATTTFADEAIYTLTAATGSLTVTLLPAEAVTAGAHWNIDGGAWQDSGATEADLELGAHAVRYQETVGYTAPVPETVTIT